MTLARTNGSRRQAWTRWAQPRLLDLRLRDLGLKIEGTWIAECINELEDDLQRRGIRFRPPNN